MNYVINHKIHFDSANRLLKVIDNKNTTIQLSRPGTRLLSELINHAGEIMAREDLIKKVWEDYDLTPSGSNLSNHISLLRKAFLELKVTECIIVTVPKVGFRFAADVSMARHPPRSSRFIFSNLKVLLTPLKKKNQ